MSGEAAAIGSSAGTSSGAGYTLSSSGEGKPINPFYQTIDITNSHNVTAFNIADILGNGLGNGTGISFMG